MYEVEIIVRGSLQPRPTQYDENRKERDTLAQLRVKCSADLAWRVFGLASAPLADEDTVNTKRTTTQEDVT